MPAIPLESTPRRKAPRATTSRRDAWLIYINLFIVGAAGLVAIVLLTRASLPRSAGRASDTPFDFAYRDPNTTLRQTDRVVIDADVAVTISAHSDRADTIRVVPASTSAPANAIFTWTVTPELGAGGPTELAGELSYEGVVYRLCEAIIGAPGNFPPSQNRVYAEQYYPLGNDGPRYHTPRTVDPTPFVAFMHTAIEQTAGFDGRGGLPAHELRSLAGELIGACSAE